MIFEHCKWHFHTNWDELEKGRADVFQVYPNAILIRFNLLEFCPSMPLFGLSVCVSFEFFYSLSRYCDISVHSMNSWSVQSRNCLKLRDIAHLMCGHYKEKLAAEHFSLAKCSKEPVYRFSCLGFALAFARAFCYVGWPNMGIAIEKNQEISEQPCWKVLFRSLAILLTVLTGNEWTAVVCRGCAGRQVCIELYLSYSFVSSCVNLMFTLVCKTKSSVENMLNKQR